MKSNWVYLTIVITLIAGCSGQRVNHIPQSSSAQAPIQSASQFQVSANHYLGLAKSSTGEQANEYRLMAADMFFSAEKPNKAEALLDKVQVDELGQENSNYYRLLRSEALVRSSKYDKAISKLGRLSQQDSLSQEHRIRIQELLAGSYYRQGQLLNSAKARIAANSLIADQDALVRNHEQVWATLSRLPAKILQEEAFAEKDNLTRGWLEFSYLSHQSELQGLGHGLSNWRMNYPGHPAQKFLPQDFQNRNLDMAINLGKQPQHIALLLPQQGPFAKHASAIREGFFASYYDTPAHTRPTIKMYDTSSSSVKTLYDKAVEEGAEFVVGPLSKDNVLELGQMSPYELKVPVMVLNHHPDIEPNIGPFYQFSLNPENEARLIGTKAYQDGYKNALVLVTDNNWGQRIDQAFRAHWEQLGGTVLKTTFIGKMQDHSKEVREALNIDSSSLRSRTIKQLIIEKVEYELRRRQDVDFVLLAAPPVIARQIKPLFNFYYAGNLPIFATSSIYSGHTNPKLDRDLNGVYFCDMPWLLQNESKGQQQPRLFAMGKDAYALSQQMQRLLMFPDLGYPGATGTLYMQANHVVERKLVWAKIEQGEPVVLETTS